MARSRGAWTLAILAFVVSVPFAFYLGITLIGHARPVLYVSVWLDRLLMVITVLGLPLAAAFCVFRLVSGRGTHGS